MERVWWKEAVIYEIYPASFKDSNGDGIGDIPGITSKLDYLKDLGVTCVWLCPVYRSPNIDGGYDISDYQNIQESFGTLEQWDEMLAEMHKRGIKLMMDIVVNHSSDKHPWFIESRSSKDNPKRDFYIWKDGKDGKPPNDWGSCFSGPAWQYDEKTDQYYLHLFAVEQPDLNWDNPELRQEVYKMMRWWLERGVDGFRMDVISFISKVAGYPSMDECDYKGIHPFVSGPHIHEYLQEMNREVLSKYDCVTVAETPGCYIEDAKNYGPADGKELSMIFQYDLLNVDSTDGDKYRPRKFRLPEFKEIITNWQVGLDGCSWNALYIQNHDQPRVLSRWGNDSPEFRKVSAKMLCTLNFTLQGTPYVYQGEEIGMTNMKFNSINDTKDVEAINYWNEYVKRGRRSAEDVLAALNYTCRDNARTPMQWDDSENGGFTTGKPWLPTNPNYKEINTKVEIADPDSIYNYYKKIIGIRKENLVMIYGHYKEYYHEDLNIFVYTRRLDNQLMLVALNFTKETHDFVIPIEIVDEIKGAKLVISNYDNDDNIPTKLRPYEAIVYLK